MALGEMRVDLELNTAKWKNNIAKASQDLNQISKSTQRTAEHMSNLDKIVGRLQRSLIAFGGILVIRELSQGLKSALDAMINFNSQLETANLGISSILLSQGKFTNSVGQTVEGYEALIVAQKMSGSIIKQLQADNLKTIATFSQLTKAFQQTLAPALEKGFDIQQVRQYTVAMVQAAGALGLNLDMLAEETRSMLRGTITPRTTLIATALGITNEQIRQYEGNAQGLFDFVMGKLKAFSDAGIESQKTWAGMTSNLKDAFEMLLGTGLKPLFDYLKVAMQELTNSIIVLNKMTGELELNPRFVKGLELLSKFLTTTGDLAGATTRWGVALAPLAVIFEQIAKEQKKIREEQNNIELIEQMRFVPNIDLRMKEEIARAEQGAKTAKIIGDEWLATWHPIVDQMKELGIVSEISLKAAAKSGIETLEDMKGKFHETGEGARDYANALKAVIAQMEKLTGPDITGELVKGTTDLEAAMKAIPGDDPDRQKKLNSLIDDWLKTRKEIQAKKITPEVDIPKYEQQLNEMKQKVISIYGDIFTTVKDKIKDDYVVMTLDKGKIQGEFDFVYDAFKNLKASIEKEPVVLKIEMQGGGAAGTPTNLAEWAKAVKGGGGGTTDIWNKVNAERNLPYMTPGGTPTYEKSEANVDFTASGLSPKIPLGRAFDKIEERTHKLQDNFSNLKANITVYGIGSTKKPIADKIQEIIGMFGSLEDALAGMEATINLEGLTYEYSKLQKQLGSVSQYPAGVWQTLSLSGNPMGWFNIPSNFWDQMKQQQAEITHEMKMLEMKMDYERMKIYGGSMQAGGIVSKTGFYKLHEGERVTSKSVSMGNINITVPTGTTKEQAKEIAKQLALILKYKRSGDLAEYV